MHFARGYLIPRCREKADGRLEETSVEILDAEKVENEVKEVFEGLLPAPIPSLADKLSERIKGGKEENLLMLAPADSRYPFFVSSLGCHLLTTSAVAFCLAKEKGVENENVHLLRIAALTHDLGKLRDIPRHEESTLEILEETGFLKILGESAHLLKDMILCHESDLLEKRLEEAEEVRRKQLESSRNLFEILQMADKFSAGMDRLLEAIGEKEPKRLPPNRGDLEQMKEELEKRVAKIREGLREKPPEKLQPPTEGPLCLVCIDVRSVQAFVAQGGKLHDLRGGSRVIEDTFPEAKKIVVEKGMIPPEAFLIDKGGRLVFLCSSNSTEKVIENVTEVFRKRGLKTSSSRIPFDPAKDIDFSTLWQTLSCGLLISKYTEKPAGGGLLWGYLERCQACKERKFEVEDRGDKLCAVCESKREKGREIFAKVFAELVEGDPELIKLRENLPEFIAGTTVARLMERRTLPNLSILRADGNLVGELFARCMSFTQLLEMCSRLDRFCDRTKIKVGELFARTSGLGGEDLDDLDRIRFNVGDVFIAGDDILWILPSWASPIVALVCAREFFIELGGETSLSMGIASIHPKAPIGLGLKLANELLNNAKKSHREDRKNGVRSAGYLDFEVCFSDIPSRGTFLTGRKVWGDYLSRPLKLSLESVGLESTDGIDVLKMIEMILGQEVKLHEENVLKQVKQLILSVPHREGLKDTIDRMRESTAFFKPGETCAADYAITHTAYQRARRIGGEEGMKTYDKIFDMLVEKLGAKPKLLDAYVLARILEGGFG
jgi:HD superfamily phosphodiesterase